MTAIGFVMIALVFAAAFVHEDVVALPDWLQIAFGCVLVLGVALTIAGIGLWLWSVMP